MECLQCKERCAHNFQDLDKLTQKKVNEELLMHGHPSSRDVPISKNNKKKRKRTTGEAIEELKFHYKYAHNF